MFKHAREMSMSFIIAILVTLAVTVIVIGIVVRLVCACFSSEIRGRIKSRPVVHAVWFILAIVIAFKYGLSYTLQ